MSSDSLVEMIKKVGFSEYEARCYLALLERDFSTVNEVAKLSGVVRSSAYDVLEKLLMKGFVAVVPGKVKRYTASAPGNLKEKSLEVFKESTELELEDLKRRQQANLENKLKEISERKEVVKSSVDELIEKLDSVYKIGQNNSNPLEYIEVLKNPDQIYHKTVQMCFDTTKEMLAFVKPPFSPISEKQKVEREELQKEAAKRGVQIRNIHEIPIDEAEREPFYKSLYEVSDDEGNEDRIIRKLPMKMLVFDEKTVMFTLEDPLVGRSSLTGIVAEHPPLARCLKRTFESFWLEARDYFILNDRKYYLSKSGKAKIEDR